MDVTLITGASSGLGAIFARKLAAKKNNLVLVARREEKLQSLTAELIKAYDISVFVEAADLSTPKAVDKLMKRLAIKKLEVTCLINNAGFGALGAFVAQNIRRQTEMINLNCTALMQLCHAVLPAMQRRKSGSILNVSSTAAFQAGPNMAVYYASKAFVLSFSEALHEEVKHEGIKVSCLCPGPTKTEFFDAVNASSTKLTLFGGDAEEVVNDGLAALARNQAFIVSGVMNKIFVQAGRLSPRVLSRTITKRMNKS
ncbi:MAG: SDR family oxidoreductase [Aestuariivirga sp.]